MEYLLLGFDDEGNYEYKEIGEAVIKSIPGVTDHGNKFVCLENEKISLIPEVEFLAGTTAADYELYGFVFLRIPKERHTIMSRQIRWL